MIAGFGSSTPIFVEVSTTSRWLRAAVRAGVEGDGATRNGGLLTNLRQHEAIGQTLVALDEGRAAVEAGLPQGVYCERGDW